MYSGNFSNNGLRTKLRYVKGLLPAGSLRRGHLEVLLCCMALQLLRICVQIPVPLLRPPQANDVKPLPTFLLNGMEVLTFVCRLLGKDTSGPD